MCVAQDKTLLLFITHGSVAMSQENFKNHLQNLPHIFGQLSWTHFLYDCAQVRFFLCIIIKTKNARSPRTLYYGVRNGNRQQRRRRLGSVVCSLYASCCAADAARLFM